MPDEFGQLAHCLNSQKRPLSLLLLKFNGKLPIETRIFSNSINLATDFAQLGLETVSIDVDYFNCACQFAIIVGHSSNQEQSLL